MVVLIELDEDYDLVPSSPPPPSPPPSQAATAASDTNYLAIVPVDGGVLKRPRRSTRFPYGHHFVDGSTMGLPIGWVIEYRPRTSEKYNGRVDLFYYEPVTWKQHRSWISVQKRLAEIMAEEMNVTPLQTALPNGGHRPSVGPNYPYEGARYYLNPDPGSAGPSTKKKMKKKMESFESFDHVIAPEPIRWVLPGAENGQWSGGVHVGGETGSTVARDLYDQYDNVV